MILVPWCAYDLSARVTCVLTLVAQDVISFVEFRQNVEIATKYHKQALQHIHDFWYLLLRRDGEFGVLWRATQLINAAEARADRSYQAMLTRYPKSGKLWRSYAKFHMHVRLDMKKAVRVKAATGQQTFPNVY